MKKILCLLLAVLMMASFTACSDNDEDAGGGGGMRDVYEVYGLKPGERNADGDSLESLMSEKPPSAILLQPLFYNRPYYNTVPQSGEILLEKGKSANIGLDLELTHTSGKKYNIKSSITLKYDGKKGEDLFHADTSTYGNPTLVIDGLYVSEYGDHVVKDKPAHFRFVSAGENYGYNFNAPEELIYVTLQVDKGKATRGDGNIGFLYFRIAGVKR
jgi:hypothetical protein